MWITNKTRRGTTYVLEIVHVYSDAKPVELIGLWHINKINEGGGASGGSRGSFGVGAIISIISGGPKIKRKHVRDIVEELVKDFVHGNGSGSPGALEGLDVDAVDVLKGILRERNGLALASHAEFEEGGVHLGKVSSTYTVHRRKKTHCCCSKRHHGVCRFTFRRVLRVRSRQAAVVVAFEYGARHHLVLDGQLDGGVVERQRKLQLTL